MKLAPIIVSTLNHWCLVCNEFYKTGKIGLLQLNSSAKLTFCSSFLDGEIHIIGASFINLIPLNSNSV